MDDPAPPDAAHLWEHLATSAHPSFARILAQAQEIQQWAMQTESVSEPERAKLLKHLAALEAMASQMVTLTAPVSNQRDE